MGLLPIVRYMIICHDWGVDPANSRRANIYGLLSTIYSLDEPPYPLVCPELCIYLALTETRGDGTAQIICVFEEAGQRIFGTRERNVAFANEPLTVVGVPFRILDCRFPYKGLYSIQFWYNGVMIQDRPLRMR